MLENLLAARPNQGRAHFVALGFDHHLEPLGHGWLIIDGKDASAPKGLTVSSNRAPQWTDDLQAIVFGLHEPRPRDAAASTDDDTSGNEEPSSGPAQGGGRGDAPAAEDRVDLVLWHYKDPRLQTQQEVQEARDRAYNYAAIYRVASKKFVRLADDEMRDVTTGVPHAIASSGGRPKPS